MCFLLQVTGQIQETVGGIIGNDRMRAEGAATREGGKAEVNAAKAENRAEATGTDIKGHAKDAFGKKSMNWHVLISVACSCVVA